MAYRSHEPITLEEFNGLWRKGDAEECPLDHFSDGENFDFVGTRGFRTRYGLGLHQSVVAPLGNVVRIYNFITALGNSLIVLTYDGTDGKIYHVVNSTTVHGPLLTIAGMTDFGFVPYAGRGYITPFTTTVVNGLNVEKGMTGEFLYVYKGDGTAARKAGATAPTGTMSAAVGAAGNSDGGHHAFGVVFETDTGYLSSPGGFVSFNMGTGQTVNFTNVPFSGSASVVKRHIVATIRQAVGPITDFVNQTYFFIPNATIHDNVTTTISNVGFFDADLLEDASHLMDNYADIPAGVGLCMYHGRMCLYTTANDISIVLVSAVGEPEAFDQVDGLIIVPLDGNPITNGAELRDVLYLFKRSKTVGYVDNGDVPSTWQMTTIDDAIGTSVHGIATVIDSGSSSVNMLLIASYKGIMIFNGIYALPELSWKISADWLSLVRNDFRHIQMLNDSINQILYCALPTRNLLKGNYSNGLDPKAIRWTKHRFDIKINTIALVNIDDLVLGAEAAI